LGAADQCAWAQGVRDDDHNHHDHHQPDGDHHHVTWGDHDDVTHGDYADDDGGSRAAGADDLHPDAYRHTDDSCARPGTGVDDDSSAAIALSGFPQRHRYTGVP
jgi:hypothetical protein